MPELPTEIRRMVKANRLEELPTNPEHAQSLIDMAQRHVQTARVVATTDDHAMAFTAAYDAARKSLAAVLAINGLRVRPVGGAHRNTGIAAGSFVNDEALADFEWMRQVRNATECPSEDEETATRHDVAEGISAAEAIVRACADYLTGVA